MAHRVRGVLRVIETGQAWLEATCRYKSVPDGGLRSLLVRQIHGNIGEQCTKSNP